MGSTLALDFLSRNHAWGAHAPRVQRTAPSPSALGVWSSHHSVSSDAQGTGARAHRPAREARALPKKATASFRLRRNESAVDQRIPCAPMPGGTQALLDLERSQVFLPLRPWEQIVRRDPVLFDPGQL